MKYKLKELVDKMSKSRRIVNYVITSNNARYVPKEAELDGVELELKEESFKANKFFIIAIKEKTHTFSEDFSPLTTVVTSFKVLEDAEYQIKLKELNRKRRLEKSRRLKQDAEAYNKKKEQNKQYQQDYRLRKQAKEQEEQDRLQDDVEFKQEIINDLAITEDLIDFINYFNKENNHVVCLNKNFKPNFFSYKASTVNIIKQIKNFDDLNNVTLNFNTFSYKTKNRQDENLRFIQNIVVDLDELVDLNRLEEILSKRNIPNPSMIINSGNGYHLFWKIQKLMVEETEDISMTTKRKSFKKFVKEIQATITQSLIEENLNADMQFAKDLTRSTRIPGSYNVKTGKETKLVKLEKLDESLQYNVFSDFKDILVTKKEHRLSEYRRINIIGHTLDKKETKYQYNKKSARASKLVNPYGIPTYLPVVNFDYIKDIITIINHIQDSKDFLKANNSCEGFRYILTLNACLAGYDAYKLNKMFVEPRNAEEVEDIVKIKERLLKRESKINFMNLNSIVDLIETTTKVVFSEEFILKLKLIKNSDEVTALKKQVKLNMKDLAKQLRKEVRQLTNNFETYMIKKINLEKKREFKTKIKTYRKVSEELGMEVAHIKSIDNKKNIYLNALSQNILTTSNNLDRMLESMVSSEIYFSEKEKYDYYMQIEDTKKILGELERYFKTDTSKLEIKTVTEYQEAYLNLKSVKNKLKQQAS